MSTQYIMPPLGMPILLHNLDITRTIGPKTEFPSLHCLQDSKAKINVLCTRKAFCLSLYFVQAWHLLKVNVYIPFLHPPPAIVLNTHVHVIIYHLISCHLPILCTCCSVLCTYLVYATQIVKSISSRVPKSP